MRKNSVVYLIGRIRRKVHRFMDQELKAHGIDDLIVSQGSILAVLYKMGGKLTMKEIADLARRDKSTVTYLTNKLIEKGYIAKQACECDARVTYIVLTDKARTLESTFRTISEHLMHKTYNDLTPEEAEELERLLEKVENNYEDIK